jgi:hypothetical protein
MADGAAEEDIATARVLLAERSPEEIAALLVRMHRGLMPAPEELRPTQPNRAGARDSARHHNRQVRRTNKQKGLRKSMGVRSARICVCGDPRVSRVSYRCGIVVKLRHGYARYGCRYAPKSL